jgi:hypothetical protein
LNRPCGPRYAWHVPDKADKVEEALVEGALAVMGWLTILAGGLLLIFGVVSFLSHDSEAGMELGFGLASLVIGLLLLGFSTVIRKLCEIEHHLKGPRESSATAPVAEGPNSHSASAG